MKVFIDTNVLVYATNQQSPFHLQAEQRLDQLQRDSTIWQVDKTVSRWDYGYGQCLEVGRKKR